MTEKIIIYVALFFIYFHIGGLATTNIIRLTKGNTLPVLSANCTCDNCGYKIPAFLQLPIVSFIICKGKCKNCGIQIPVFSLVLEFAVMLGMFLISFIFKISYLGIILSFVYYEGIRIITIIINGKREKEFLKSYLIAVVSMVPFFALTMFVSLIYSII